MKWKVTAIFRTEIMQLILTEIWTFPKNTKMIRRKGLFWALGDSVSVNDDKKWVEYPFLVMPANANAIR